MMVWVSSSSQKEQSMRVSSVRERFVGKEERFSKMVSIMRETLEMTKQMDLVHSETSMEGDTMGNGMKISNMVWEQKYGIRAQRHIQVSLNMGRKMVKVDSHGKMVATMMGIL